MAGDRVRVDGDDADLAEFGKYALDGLARRTRLGDEVVERDRLGRAVQNVDDCVDVLRPQTGAGRQQAGDADGARIVDQHRSGRLSVAAGPADLLVVLVQAARDAGVHYRAHVRLVDSHAEGAGSHDHIDRATEEPVLHRGPLGGGQPGVVGRRGERGVPQPVGDGLAAFMGQRVDERRRLVGDDDLHDPVVDGLGLGQVRAGQVCGQAQVGPVEADDHHRRLVHPQRPGDVGLNRRGRRGRQRQLPWPPQRRYRLGNSQVLRSEVVTPLADQMGLVNDEQAHPAGAVDQALMRLGVVQLLGAQQQKVEPALIHRGERGAAIVAMLTRVEHRRAGSRMIGPPAPGQAPQLVALQRDQRGDHHRQSAERQAGDLVDRALPAAGWHDRECVAAGHQRNQRASLRFPQVNAEDRRRDPIDVGQRSRVGDGQGLSLGFGGWQPSSSSALEDADHEHLRGGRALGRHAGR